MAAIVDNPIELTATVVILLAFLMLLSHVIKKTDQCFKKIEQAINVGTATIQSLHLTVIQQEHHGIPDEARVKRLESRYEALIQEMQHIQRLLQMRGHRPDSDPDDLMSTIVGNLTKRDG